MGKVTSIVNNSAKQMETSLAAVKSAFGAITAAFTVDKIKSYIESTIEAADKMNDLRTRTGLTGQELLVLEGAAVRGGQSLDSISDVTSKLSKRFGAAEVGTGETAKALAAMGLSAVDAQGKLKSVGEIMREAGELFAQYEDGADKAALATALFGKGGDKLIPVVEGIKDTEERFKRLGITIDEDVITAADKFRDSLEDVRSLNELFARQLVAQLLPYLQQLVDLMIQFKAKGAETGDTLYVLVAGVKVLAAGFYGLYTAIAAAGEILVGFALTQNDMIRGRFFDAPKTIAAAWDKAKERLAGYADFVGKLDPLARAQVPETTESPLVAQRRSAPKLPDLKGAAEIAKAQLKLDLENIKKEADIIKNGYDNDLRITQAYYAAGKIEENEFYDIKREFLMADSEVQEQALLDQISRLEREKSATKDMIENKKKIADLDAQLAKVRANSAASENIINIEQARSLIKVQQAYLQVRQAAEEYLAAQQRTQGRELAGMGAGNQERDRAAARAQIDDKYEADRRALENAKKVAELNGPLGTQAKEKYDKELALINDFQQSALSSFDVYYAARLQKESDWSVGASEAMKNYADESRNVAKQTETLFTNAFKNMEDALVNFAKTGKLDFKSLADSIISDLIRIQIRQSLTAAMSVVGGTDGLIGSALKLFGLGSSGTASLGDHSSLFEGVGLEHAATGADWMVGGSGGTDSKIAQFRVTPGEQISVRTPEQQRQSPGDTAPVINISIPVNAPGADVGTVERLKAVVAELPRQIVPQVLNQLNRSSATRRIVRGR